MKTFDYVITDELGIHARPAGLLCKLAKSLDSKITVEKAICLLNSKLIKSKKL